MQPAKAIECASVASVLRPCPVLAMLEETIAVLGDADLTTRLAAAEADLVAARVETQEDREAAMRSRLTSA